MKAAPLTAEELRRRLGVGTLVLAGEPIRGVRAGNGGGGPSPPGGPPPRFPRRRREEPPPRWLLALLALGELLVLVALARVLLELRRLRREG